ncbi:hypothetical protein J6590_057572 [Homalodisca vitripennis]|nr:hypothetical protein J6590_057572 [Homalodisca vitripennis]
MPFSNKEHLKWMEKESQIRNCVTEHRRSRQNEFQVHHHEEITASPRVVTSWQRRQLAAKRHHLVNCLALQRSSKRGVDK